MKLYSVTPELIVEDVQKTVTFYTSILGFTLIDSVPFQNEVKMQWALVENNGVNIMLEAKEVMTQEFGLAVDTSFVSKQILFFGVGSVDNFYEKIGSLVQIIKKPYLTNYNTKELAIFDIDKNILIFSQKL